GPAFAAGPRPPPHDAENGIGQELIARGNFMHFEPAPRREIELSRARIEKFFSRADQTINQIHVSCSSTDGYGENGALVFFGRRSARSARHQNRPNSSTFG